MKRKFCYARKYLEEILSRKGGLEGIVTCKQEFEERILSWNVGFEGRIVSCMKVCGGRILLRKVGFKGRIVLCNS